MRFIVAAAMTLLLAGCGLFDHGTEWKDGPFEILWIDTTSTSHLAYRDGDSSTSIGITDECAFAAGSNDEFVVVKKLNTNSTAIEYYVVSKAIYHPYLDTANSVIGPLSEGRYRELGQKVRLPNLREVVALAACRSAA